MKTPPRLSDLKSANKRSSPTAILGVARLKVAMMLDMTGAGL